LEWGSAELQARDRSLAWHYHEPLVIPAEQPRSGQG